jgi:hypothetical protein
MLISNTDFFPMVYHNAEAQEILRQKSDNWADTPFKGYVNIDPKQKGECGELVLSDFLLKYGYNVKSRENAGHDLIVNDIKVEEKFSLANRNKKGIVQPDRFIFNHFSIGKDWERAILMAVNPDTTYIVWFTRTDLQAHLLEPRKSRFFNRGQGGENGKNDDWLYTSTSKKKSWQNFLKLPWVKSLEEW